MPDPSRLPVSGQVAIRDGSGSLFGLFVLIQPGRDLPDAIGPLPLDGDGQFFATVESPAESPPQDFALALVDSHGRILAEARSRASHSRGRLTTTVEFPSDSLRDAVPATDLVADVGAMGNRASSGIVRLAQRTFLQEESWASALDCLEGPLSGFPRLHEDASGVLTNDPDALVRFRGILDVLAERAIDNAVRMGRDARLLHQPIDEEEWRQLAAAGRHVEPMRVEVGSLLLAAARVAAGPDSSRAWRDSRVILEALILETRTAPLRAPARQALNGSIPGRNTFIQMLMSMECDPFGQWVPPPTGENGLPGVVVPEDSRLLCLGSYLSGFDGSNGHDAQAAVSYQIDAATPTNACPGDVITITGDWFGHKHGKVRFAANPSQSPTGNSYVDTAAKSWSNTLISVMVPPAAAPGPLSLLIQRGAGAICGKVYSVPAPGNQVAFGGPSWRVIESLTVGGDVTALADGSVLVAPGADVEISWSIAPPGPGTLRIFTLPGNTEIYSTEVQAQGTEDWPLPWPDETRRLRVELTAASGCGDAVEEIIVVYNRAASLVVNGVETTQGIQHYRSDEHLTNSGHHGAINSLQLVRDKTAWVRTYLRSGQDPTFDNGQLADVTGTLTVERRVGNVWNTVATILPHNGPVTAENTYGSYDSERSDIDATLNFVVPAATMTGLLRFTVLVWSPLHPQILGNAASHTWQVAVDLRKTLNVAFVTIGYNGPNADDSGTLTLPAPTLNACVAETSWALKTFPVSGAPNVRIAGSFETNQPMNDDRLCDGCCTSSWIPLLIQITATAALDQAGSSGQWLYYGLVASGIPVTVRGCSNVLGTGSIEGNPSTFAHELGHMLGLPHAPCGPGGIANDDYPDYEPYGPGSIGEYGLDIDGGPTTIMSPADWTDFMSYCSPRWISMYTHKHLTGIAELSPVTGPIGAGAPGETGEEEFSFARSETVLQPLIHMLGVIEVDGRVTVASVARLETRFLRGRGRSTGYVAQLLDETGRVLAQNDVFAYPARGCSCGSGGDGDGSGDGDGDRHQPLMFKAMVDDVARGASLRIVNDNEVVWERRGAEEPPTLANVVATLETRGAVTLSWSVDGAPEQETEVWIRWSNDGGRSWHALTVGQRGSSVGIDPAQIPAGDVRFEVLVHDGFHTVTSVSEPIGLPAKPPAVSILQPESAARHSGNRQIHLFGVTASHGRGEVDPLTAVWYLDGQPIATGFDAWVDTPTTGQHEIRLETTHEGQVAVATVQIDATPDTK